MKQTIKEEVSAGGVVYKKVGNEYLFLIGKHSGYHKWVLPKGMVEIGETVMETAVREVEEEVGVSAKISDMAPLKTIEYFYMADIKEQKGLAANGEETVRRVVKYQEDGGGKVKIHKKVVFYLMELETDLGKEGWEMEERRWVSFDEGRELLAFETEQEVFDIAGKALGASDQEPACRQAG